MRCIRCDKTELLYGADAKTADRICSFNRRWAERGGYWESSTLAQTMQAATEVRPTTARAWGLAEVRRWRRRSARGLVKVSSRQRRQTPPLDLV